LLLYIKIRQKQWDFIMERGPFGTIEDEGTSLKTTPPPSVDELGAVDASSLPAPSYDHILSRPFPVAYAQEEMDNFYQSPQTNYHVPQAISGMPQRFQATSPPVPASGVYHYSALGSYSVGGVFNGPHQRIPAPIPPTAAMYGSSGKTT